MIIEALHSPENIDGDGADDDQSKRASLKGTVRGIPDGPGYLGWGPNPRLFQDILAPAFISIIFFVTAIYFASNAFTAYTINEWWDFSVSVLMAVIIFLAASAAFYAFYLFIKDRPPRALRNP